MPEDRKEEQEPTVRVVDRRRLNPDGSERATDESAAETAAPPETSAPTDETSARTAPPDEKSFESEATLLSVADLVRVTMVQLSMSAWIHLGLLANPGDNKVAKDLAQARLAIDCIAALVEKLSPTVQPQEREELQRMLTDLRMNFVQQQSGA